MMPRYWVVIPARYASSRLPAKALLEIDGKPMLAHVHQKALASGAERVIIATDDKRIEAAALKFGAEVCMTAKTHNSGTDRVAEVLRQHDVPEDLIVVNVQGDEPLLPSVLIQQVAIALHKYTAAQVATLCEPITTNEAIFNPNVVKVVRDKHGFALYFSRAPVPFLRDHFAQRPEVFIAHQHFRHIGIYAYRAAYLQHCTQLPPCALELGEALEQLRILHDGGKIYVAEAVVDAGIGVDTPEDLARVRALFP
jgi:3-deoxy-manno-octulosonate cytidylyltransferase (CMP-KDO synthetase)